MGVGMERHQGNIANEAPVRNLGEVLLGLKMVSPEQLKQAKALESQTGKRLCDILVVHRLVTAEDMAAAISMQLNMPLIDLKRHIIQPDALKLIPEETARKYNLIPLYIIGDSLIVVMSDPEDLLVIEEAKSQSRMRVQVALGIPSDIKRAIDVNYKTSAEIEKLIPGKPLPLLSLTQLGFSADALKKYQTVLKSPYGMILVGGLTGSGKTTTLYASINELNRKERNIMTIEDPVEYCFTDVKQTQVNPKAGLTFSNGLRALLRHDPSIILVGEIRDKETAAMAVQACLTGHLMLSSIHANDAIGALFRLKDLGIEPYLIASTLVGVVAQRMVRRICTRCRVPYQPSAKEKAVYLDEIERLPIIFYKGEGCHLCAGTGYGVRTGIFELLVMSEKIGEMLTGNASYADIRKQAIKEGMATLKHDGMLKVKEGITTVDEVVQAALTPGAAISFFEGKAGQMGNAEIIM
jgi:Tfp pilus assembly pilus retraction ATPase PilT